MPQRLRFAYRACLAIVATLFASAPALGVDISGVQNAAFDQPKVNAVVFPQPTPGVAPGGEPLASDASGIADLLELLGLDPGALGISATNIEMFYDTGAGVGLFGAQTAAGFGIPGQADTAFADVGVGGLATFGVSERLTVKLGSTTPVFDPTDLAHYTHTFTDVYAAIGEPPSSDLGLDVNDPTEQVILQYLNALFDFSVAGMPFFKDKTVVMDVSGLNDFVRGGANVSLENLDAFETLYTHVYDNDAAPAFDPSNDASPGVPAGGRLDLTLELEYADFSGLTVTDGTGTGPNLAHNPMIGGGLPDHFNETVDDRDDLPGVTITYGAAESEGTYLFDTGAAATIISLEQAANLGVTYVPGFEPSEAGPVRLEDEDGVLADQFSLQLTGVGGTITVAGFYLDELTLPTLPEAIDFQGAPVLVADISIEDPLSPGGTFTLDGVFGMNFLVPTTFLDGPIDVFGGALDLLLVPGAFDYVTYDEATNTVGFVFDPEFIPEPGVFAMMLAGGLPLLARRRRAA